MLREAGFELHWDPTAKDGAGCYVSPHRNTISVSSHSEWISRHSTAIGQVNASEITPEEADARQFEERLHRAIKEGSFLTLLVNPKYHERARDELCRRFPVQLVDFEGVFLTACEQVAEKSQRQVGSGPRDRRQTARGRLGQVDDAGRAGDAGG